MQTLTTIILALSLSSVNAQIAETKSAIKDNKKEVKREFKNQGEQEEYWAKQFFDEKYSKQHFEKFKGDIIKNENSFIYDEKTIVVTNTQKDLKTIFSSGIFYPNIIFGEIKSIIKSQAELDTLSTTNKLFYNLNRTDSLMITDLVELKFLSNSSKYKRFKFWLWKKGFANPTACFIELTNESVTNNTDLTNFIIGASLTFFKEGWIGI
jgi:hypothetical protein